MIARRSPTSALASAPIRGPLHRSCSRPTSPVASSTRGYVHAGSRVRIGRTTPHEVGHQWFYALVGNDQGRDPWIDEGLASLGRGAFVGNLGSFVGTRRSRPTARGHAGEPMTFWDAGRGSAYYRGRVRAGRAGARRARSGRPGRLRAAAATWRATRSASRPRRTSSTRSTSCSPTPPAGARAVSA